MLWKFFSLTKQLLCLLASVFFATAAQAYFQDAVSGARPAGMGEAFVAIADDANALLYNPAGLAQLYKPEVMGMYSNLYTNLNAHIFDSRQESLGYNYLSLIYPAEMLQGVLGASWIQLHSVFYQENTITLSYAKKVETYFPFNMGVNLKLLHVAIVSNQFTRDTNLFPSSNLDTYGITGDIGILTAPWKGITIGAAIDTIVPVYMGLSGKQAVPMTLKIGGAYKYNFNYGQVDSIQITLENSFRYPYDNFKLGLETWLFKNKLAVRTGVNLNRFTSGISFYSPLAQSPFQATIDYAFTMPFYISGSAGSHRLGLKLTWDEPTGPNKPKSPILLLYEKALKAIFLEEKNQAEIWWQKILEMESDNQSIKDYLVTREEAFFKTDTSMEMEGSLSSQRNNSGQLVLTKRIASLDPLEIRNQKQKKQIQFTVSQDPEQDTETYIQERLQLAQYNYQNKNLPQVVNELQSILVMQPDHPHAKNQLAIIKEAIQIQSDSYFKQGLKYITQKSYLAALEMFGMILKFKPDFSPAQKQIEVIKRLINDDFRRKYQEGIEHFNNGNYQQALEFFSEIKNIFPEYLKLPFYFEKTQLKLRLIKSAPSIIQQVNEQQKQSNLDEALHLLSPLIKEDIQIEKFLKLFDQLIGDKALALRRFHQGMTAVSKDDFETATALFQKSYTVDHNKETIHMLIRCHTKLGISAFRKGRLKQARHHWKSVLLLDATNSIIVNYMEKTREKMKNK